MSYCSLCGKVVLFRDAHASCEREWTEARDLLHSLVRDSIVSSKDLNLTRQQTLHLARARQIGEEEYQEILAAAWDSALDYCLSDNLFTPDEMTRMREACFRLGVSTAILEKRGVPRKIEDFKRRTMARKGPPKPGPLPKDVRPNAKAPQAKASAPKPSKLREWEQWLDEEARWQQNAKHGKFKAPGEEKEPDLR